MRPRAHVLGVLACLLLAGCSLPGESTDEGSVDDTEYTGEGIGLAVQLVNKLPHPVEVELLLRSDRGAEIARADLSLEGNGTAEKWWSVPTAGGYNLDMHYDIRNGSRTAAGSDRANVEVGATCLEVTRAGWRFQMVNDSFGHAYLGRSCAAARDAS